MTTDAVLIARNIRLTFKLVAKEIYVTPAGEVFITTRQFGPKAPIPDLTVEYLEAICSRFYYGGYAHQNAIADIMLLNSVLTAKHYGDFYNALRSNLSRHKITVISSELFL